MARDGAGGLGFAARPPAVCPSARLPACPLQLTLPNSLFIIWVCLFWLSR